MAGSVVAFDCSAAVEHTVLAKQITIGEQPDEKVGTIPVGWNGKHDNEFYATGVDIVVGELRERYAVKMKISELTATWRASIGELVGSINEDTFGVWGPGTALFLGCSYTIPTVTDNGDIDTNKKVDVYFHFLIRPRGFDYYWCTYRNEENILTGQNEPTPDIWYKATMYPSASFAMLGI